MKYRIIVEISIEDNNPKDLIEWKVKAGLERMFFIAAVTNIELAQLDDKEGKINEDIST